MLHVDFTESCSSGYVTGGRYFQSIEIPEGARLTNAVIDLVGDQENLTPFKQQLANRSGQARRQRDGQAL